MFERDRLRADLLGIGARMRVDVFDELAAHYGANTRHYHDKSHVATCLVQLERFRHFARRAHEIAVALWFHDAIYDVRRADNEQASAAWAEQYLESEGVASAVVRRVVEMILGTKTHDVTGEDAQLMVDIDLGILGTERRVYEAYCCAIRKEYEHVEEAQYRLGRVGVLTGFLERDCIYRTPALFERYESKARENLGWEIGELSA